MHAVEALEQRKPIKPFLVTWFIALMFYAVVAETAGRNISLFFDFRTFYSAGTLVRSNPAALFDLEQQHAIQNAIANAPLLPFSRPAYEALLFTPFSLLPYRDAYLAFTVFNLTLVMAAFFAARDAFSATIPLWQPRAGLMFFPFLPLIAAIFHGQDSVVSLFLCCLAWRFRARDRIVLAGFILSLGLFKFNLFLPLVLILGVRKGWKLVAGFVPGALLVAITSFALVGRSGTAAFLSVLRTCSLLLSNDAATQNTFATFPLAMGNLYGLVYALGHARLGPAALAGIASSVSLVVLLVAFRCVRREPDDRVVFSIAILSALLVSHHLNAHDLTLLLLPLALLHSYPKHAFWALLAFGMPPALLLVFGSDSFFVLAVPLVVAFFALARFSYIAHEPNEGRPFVGASSSEQLEIAEP